MEAFSSAGQETKESKGEVGKRSETAKGEKKRKER